MKRLLSIELQKIWLNSSSRILCLSYFILLSCIALLGTIRIEMGTRQLQLGEMGIFEFPYIWHFNTYMASIAKLFFAIVIVSMVANEYSYGTLKQNLIDGLSKKEFILSKLLTLIFFSICSTVFVFLLTLLLGFQFSTQTQWSVVFSETEYLLGFFVKQLGFFSFCLFLGLLVKRSAFALGFLLIWNMIEALVKLVLSLLLFPLGQTAKNISRLLPLESMANLIVEPFSRAAMAKSIESQLGIKDYSMHGLDILIVLSWTLIFSYLSYKILKDRDL